MFVHNSKLMHVLPPRMYWDAEQYHTEVERLLLPSWQLVGLVNEMPKNGDFVSRELLGMPILIRNFNGEHCTFLNVCPHRHSILTSLPSGCSPTLKCQYHGWEFDQEGKTGRIPDARSFRPLKGGPECLRKFPTIRCGPLILAKLGPSANADELPAKLAAVSDEYPADRWTLSERWGYDFNANWKVVIENTVETYHAEAVHPQSLVFGNGEDDLDHEIHEYGSHLHANLVTPDWYKRLADFWLSRIESDLSHQYRLAHFFPNLFWIRIDAMLQVMSVVPTSPTSCRMEVAVFVLRAERENGVTRMLSKQWGRLKCRVIKRILQEDAALYPGIQRGMQASPFRGTISVREELVHAFQRYVASGCGLDVELYFDDTPKVNAGEITDHREV